MKRPKFKVGDKVYYTNPNGVRIGEKTIVRITSEVGCIPRYYITPTDTPWYPPAETCFRKIPTNRHKA